MTRLSNFLSCVARRHRGAMETTSRTGHSRKSPDSGKGCREAGQMKACLSTFDLVSLGVGSCLGTGMYLTAGLVASTMAGPSGVFSLIIAGVASILTGLCYAELAGLCPKTSGSAYMYAYITAGELVAFVIGWGLIVEYVIGTAAGAVALSETLDSLIGGLCSQNLNRAARMMYLPKLDLLAATICVLLTMLLASGAEISAKVNNGLNLTNIAVLVFFFIASLVLGSARNWVAGGFFPFKITGVIKAIPTCYFAYIGFDTVAATGAEARNPSTSVPRAILLAIVINCLCYVIVILALTFDLPFYMLSHETAMTDVFSLLNFKAGKYVVAIGAVSGEFAAAFGSMFPLPRVLMAMASDGLIFRQLGRICPKRQTPVRATLLSGFIAMVMATFFHLSLLIELVLIGTLLAYVLVTFAVLVKRYIPEDQTPKNVLEESDLAEDEKIDRLKDQEEEDSFQLTSVYRRTCRSQRRQPDVSRSRSSSLTLSRSQSSSPRLSRSLSHSPGKSVTFSSRVQIHSERLEHSQSPENTDSDSEKSTNSNSEVPHKLAKSVVALSAGVKPRPSTFRNKESLWKLPPDSIPLLNSSPSDEEDQLLEEDELLHQQLLPPTKAVNGSSAKPVSSRQERVKSFLPTNLNTKRESKSGGLYLWSRIIAGDFVSPRRMLSLLCAIYGVQTVLCVIVSNLWLPMASGNIISLGILGVLSVVFLVLFGIVCFIPQSLSGDAFRAPLVPALPILVAFINIYLMTSLSAFAWLLFCLWMALGLLIYLMYGIKHSQAEEPSQSYIPLSSAESSIILDDDDDDDNDEEKQSLLND